MGGWLLRAGIYTQLENKKRTYTTDSLYRMSLMSFTELQVSWVVYLMMQKSRMMIDLRFGPLCCVAKVDVLVKYLVCIGCIVSLHVNPPLQVGLRVEYYYWW